MLEKNPSVQQTDIVILPPTESGTISDEDNASKKDGVKNITKIRKRALNNKSELILHHRQDNQEKADRSKDDGRPIHGRGGKELQAVPSRVKSLQRQQRKKQRKRMEADERR